MAAADGASPATSPRTNRLRRTVTAALIALGLLSILVFPGTRAIALFNLQQVVPAREGSTYYSVWHIPKSHEGCFQDHIQLPRWRLWKGEYERRKGDWRIHAARGRRPSWAWEGTRTSSGRAESAIQEESEREFAEAVRLAPDRSELHCAIAIVAMEREHLSAAGRLDYKDGVYLLKPDWKSPVVAPARLEHIRSCLGEARRLDPDNGFPLVVEATLLFALGRDQEAFEALARAEKAATVKDYWPGLAQYYSAFLTDLGVLSTEAKVMARPRSTPSARSTRNLLIAKAIAARDSGQHQEAAKCIRMAALVHDSLNTTAIPSGGMAVCLARVFAAKGEQAEEERLAAGLAYLREHGETDLAARAQEQARGRTIRRSAREAGLRREMLLDSLGTGVLVASAVILLLALALTLLCLLSLQWRSGPSPEVSGWRRLFLHIMCLLTAALTAVCAATASSSFQIKFMFAGEPPYEPPALMMCALPLLLLFLTTFLVSANRENYSLQKGRRWDWPSTKTWLLRSLAIFRQFVLVRAVVYFAFAYIAMVWAAHLVRQAAHSSL